jgi:hypothetical protein
LSGVSAFSLSGVRRVILAVAVLALLFSGFFWLGYWTGVGHTLVKHRVPMPAASPVEPPSSSPVHQVQEAEEILRL